MPMPSTLEICRLDLFTPEDDLQERYPQVIVDKVLRVREMYNAYMAEPQRSDKDLVERMCEQHGISKVTAYGDLSIVKTLLPMLSSASRDFHRWRYNEMILNTYRIAEIKKDTKTMERAASSYAKHNGIEKEDEQAVPYEMIVPQPFTATDDPRVLGIEPIPNIQEKISAMIQKYRAETIDIEDVEFEEVDLEFDKLFPEKDENDGEEDIL